jgi:hypothetical protein
VSSPEAGERQEGVKLYCLGAFVAEEAARSGFRDFARALEAALGGLLSGLPREAQGQALNLSYEIALDGDQPAPPRLRLIHSNG